MRYHATKPDIEVKIFGDSYYCDHPVYNIGTLYTLNKKGLVIIQQYFEKESKTTYWSCLEPWLSNDIYVCKDFKLLFEKYAGYEKNGLYPTITLRHALHWLKMKPPEKEIWETAFDRIVI